MSDMPRPDELETIRRAGREKGGNPGTGANECPYSPPDAQRHRAWMDGFSEGRATHAPFGPDWS